MTAIQRIALASDQEASDALQVLLKGLSVGRPELAPIIGDEQKLQAVLNEAEDSARIPTKDDAKAVRVILLQLAEGGQDAPRVIAAFDERKKLLEPVTTALVLAGIIMLLSTEIEVSSTVVDGKTSTSVHIKKGKTSDDILKKFFALFGR